MNKEVFKFESKEWHTFIFTVLSISLIIYFFKWRNTDFDVLTGLNWLILTIVMVALVSLLARMLQKWIAYRKGYKATFVNSWKSIAITLALSFFSFGFIPLLSPGRLELEPIERLRLGRVQQGITFSDLSSVSLWGIIFYVLCVIILKIIHTAAEGVVFQHLLFIFLMLAIFSALPLPFHDGICIFAKSRMLYIFLLVFILIYAALIWFTNLFSIALAILGAVMFLAFFMLKIEQQEFP